MLQDQKARQQAAALSRRAERSEQHDMLMAAHAIHRAEQARMWGAFMDAIEMHEAGFGPHPIAPNSTPPLGFGYLVTS